MTTAPRLVGLDTARGLAVLGMLFAHPIPRTDTSELLVDGRPSILFATIAGMSLGIIIGGGGPSLPRPRSALRVRVLVRALVLFFLGLFLASLDSGVAIILDYYGVMFLLLIPLLFLNRLALGIVCAALLVIVPPIGGELASRSAGTVVGDTLERYLLTGYYPALVWLPLVIAGLVCARSGLGRRATQLAMVVAGTFASVLGYGAAAVIPGVDAVAHSSTAAEIVGSGGVAIAVVGVLLLVAGHARAGFVRAVLSPVGAVGAMPLTVYTLQIVALTVVAALQDADGAGSISYPGWPLLGGLTLGSLLFAMLWRWRIGRGPLEWALGILTAPAR